MEIIYRSFFITEFARHLSENLRSLLLKTVKESETGKLDLKSLSLSQRNAFVVNTSVTFNRLTVSKCSDHELRFRFSKRFRKFLPVIVCL